MLGGREGPKAWAMMEGWKYGRVTYSCFLVFFGKRRRWGGREDKARLALGVVGGDDELLESFNLPPLAFPSPRWVV
jgi:hypothetical protein